jgi:DNA-binding protein H-NS
MDERKRDAMVAYLRRRIEEFGIKLEDRALAIKSEQPGQTEARYSNATGDSWDGRGEMPQWLKQAISAGQSIQHFELPPNVAPAPSGKERVDWRNDPFVGSPLARTHRR